MGLKKIIKKTAGNFFKTSDGVIGFANPLAGQASAMKNAVHEIKKEKIAEKTAEKMEYDNRVKQAADAFESELDAVRRRAGQSRVVFAGMLGENAIGLGGKKTLLGL